MYNSFVEDWAVEVSGEMYKKLRERRGHVYLSVESWIVEVSVEMYKKLGERAKLIFIFSWIVEISVAHAKLGEKRE